VIVGKGSYKTLLTQHYMDNTIMIAGRNDKNDKLFQTKGDDTTDWMVMFQGAHQVFSQIMFKKMKVQIKNMINCRLKGEGYSY